MFIGEFESAIWLSEKVDHGDSPNRPYLLASCRCGRTARAGASGIAISLLKGGQVSHFRRMRSIIEQPERVTDIGIKKGLVRNAAAHYRSCVKALNGILLAEEGALRKTDPIPQEYYPVI
jgi:superfamily II DNA/RNA helicase